ncbi:uncharacterized protein LOC6533324 isoform X2 [Drosophila yakuba]|uniref:Uncharacterized protein n=1 Tax=Drosophila yakuba TaxID=7245 RepID=B4PC77_DROYA|nr:uncharacterized protein LOC6533324 isoform X2 [Drosophila yakuba]EDW93762.2 uncharacterized protein Dyak_GE21618 [Drosophila yakuba]
MSHIAILLATASVFSVVQGQQQVMPMPVIEAPTQKPLTADYVKGILSLKSSLLANKPALLGYGSSQQVNSAVPVSAIGIRPGMRYTPQLDVQQPPSQPLQEIQMPSLKLNRYNQQFPAFHLFQPPFVPLPRKQERQESQDPPPTAEQLELLQQLSEFFGQRQQLQQQVRPQVATNCAQMDPDEGKGECEVHANTESCDTTKEPNKNEEEDTISVDVKNEERETTSTTAKPIVAPKTKPTKPTSAKSTTQKHVTTHATKSTTRKLPCCTKPMNQGVASAPNVISFSLNVQNENAEQSKALQQQPRSGRHAIQPDLRINAITNLLRYRRKRAQGAAPYPKPFSSQKDQGLRLQSRSKRRRDKILDKNQLLQAELKIWPISIKSNLVERLH